MVEGDSKAAFSIAIASSCREGHSSLPWIAPFIFKQYFIIMCVKQGYIKYSFLSLPTHGWLHESLC